MFLNFARKVADTLGNPKTFVLAVALIVGWLVSGPFFHYSDAWQLYINTFTTIVTFLIVVILQHSGNHDAEMLDSKLNEIIALLNRDKLSPEANKILDEHHEDLIIEAVEHAKQENEEAAVDSQDITD